MCKVSVVIPSYNREKVIITALNSVLKQTYNDYEIIVVDDGSLDNTDKVIDEFSKLHSHIDIKYIKQKNGGPSSARNNGIKHSKGQYIAFLDSDDEWEPQKLEKQIRFMEENEDIPITGTNYNIITTEKKQKYELEPKYVEADFYKMLFKVFFCMSTIIIKKDVFTNDNIWFKEGKNQGEDLLLFLQILRKYKGIRISEPLTSRYKMEYGEEGLTSDLGKMLENDFDNIRILFNENSKSIKKISKNVYIYLHFYTYLKHIKRVMVCKISLIKGKIIKRRD